MPATSLMLLNPRRARKSSGRSGARRRRKMTAKQLRYFGPRPLIEDNSVNSQSTTLAYARVGYRISPKTRLSLDVFNLFNREASDIDYYYSSQLRNEPAPVNGIAFHPVEPRTFRLTLAHNF